MSVELYEILEVRPNASDEVIRMAYKGLIKKYHPDGYDGDKEEAERKLKQINEAYEILSNKEKRAAYDENYHYENNEKIKNKGSSLIKADIPTESVFPRKKRSSAVGEKIVGALFTAGEFLIGVVCLYVIVGLVTGNLRNWNGKIIYFSKVAIHAVANMKRPDKYEEGSAEEAVRQYIKAIYDGDEYTALHSIDSSNGDLKQETEMLTKLFRQMQEDDTVQVLFQDMKEADYTIQSGKDEGWYIVTFQTCDYEMIVNQLENQYGSLEFVKTQLSERVRTARKNYKKEALVHVKMEEGWVIDGFEDDQIFLNALTGNLF